MIPASLPACHRPQSMVAIFTLSVFILCSSLSYAGQKAFTSFKMEGSNWTYQDEVLIPNMPKVRSQSMIGLCSSFTASALLEAELCRRQKKDCQKLTNDERVSPLDLSKYGENVDEGDADPTLKSSYKKIKTGVHPGRLLQNVLTYIGVVNRESCAPFDRAVSMYPIQSIEQLEAFNSLETTYNKVKTEGSACLDCAAKEISAKFPQLNNIAEIKEAFKAESLGNFHYQLFIPRTCQRTRSTQMIDVNDISLDYWPRTYDKSKANQFSADQLKDKMLSMIRDQKKPFALSGICTDDNKSDPAGCEGAHAVVITGYKKFCNPKGKCYEAFKVHNSWGEAWQNENSDGWVFAKNLVEMVGSDIAVMTWLK